MNTIHPLTLPEEVSGQIERGELIQLLEMGLDYPLILMVAPSGAGKSTLLHQWLSSPNQRRRNRTVIRYKLASKHNHEEMFVQGLLQEINAAGFDSIANTNQALASLDNENKHVIMASLPQAELPVTLVLDNFHHINSPRVVELVKQLVDQIPDHVTIVLSSRSFPAFNSRQLKLRNRVLVIDENDFKINPQELAQLNHNMGLSPLTSDEITRITATTDGWFAGAKMALIARKSTLAAPLSRINQATDASQSKLVEYFTAEVLINLSEETKTVVLGLSICDAFNLKMAEAIMQTGNMENILADIIRHGLVSHATEGESGWYYYHPTLKHFLHGVLCNCRSENYVKKLHQNAAEFFIAEGNQEKAILHARNGDSDTYYLNILQGACEQWMKCGDCDLIIRHATELELQTLSRRPLLWLLLINALIFSRRFRQAEYYIEWLDNVKTPEHQQPHRLSYLHFLKKILQHFTTETTELDLRWRTSSVSPESTSPEIRINMQAIESLLIAYKQALHGDVESTLITAMASLAQFNHVGQKLLASYAELLLMQSYLSVGDQHEATEALNRLLQSAKPPRQNLLWLNANAAKLYFEYENNQLAAASNTAKQLVPVLGNTCVTDIIVRVSIYKARMESSQENQQSAKRTLAECDRILSIGDHPRHQLSLQLEQMRKAAMRRDTGELDSLYQLMALDELTKKSKLNEKLRYSETQEQKLLAAIYYLGANNRLNEAQQLNCQLVDLLETTPLVSRLFTAQSLQATLLYRFGLRDEACRHFNNLLKAHSINHITRSTFDEAPGLAELLNYGLEANYLSLPDSFLRKFASLLNREPNEATTPNNILKTLTPKEQEIFKRLSSGLSNASIAQQSGISITTTKWHLKNIYQKLGVSNRTDAMLMALKPKS